jgi:hypothetical protein
VKEGSSLWRNGAALREEEEEVERDEEERGGRRTLEEDKGEKGEKEDFEVLENKEEVDDPTPGAFLASGKGRWLTTHCTRFFFQRLLWGGGLARLFK